MGPSGEPKAGKRPTVRGAINKSDLLERRGVEQLLGAGRKDKSGDFTPGAKLDPPQIKSVLDYVEARLDEQIGDVETIFNDWSRAVGSSSVGARGITELAEIAGICGSAGYGPTRVSFDSSVVRGLED